MLYVQRVLGDKNVMNVYVFERPHILIVRKNILSFDNEKKGMRMGGGGARSFLKRKGISPF